MMLALLYSTYSLQSSHVQSSFQKAAEINLLCFQNQVFIFSVRVVTFCLLCSFQHLKENLCTQELCAVYFTLCQADQVTSLFLSCLLLIVLHSITLAVHGL